MSFTFTENQALRASIKLTPNGPVRNNPVIRFGRSAFDEITKGVISVPPPDWNWLVRNNRIKDNRITDDEWKALWWEEIYVGGGPLPHNLRSVFFKELYAECVDMPWGRGLGFGFRMVESPAVHTYNRGEPGVHRIERNRAGGYSIRLAWGIDPDAARATKRFLKLANSRKVLYDCLLSKTGQGWMVSHSGDV